MNSFSEKLLKFPGFAKLSLEKRIKLNASGEKLYSCCKSNSLLETSFCYKISVFSMKRILMVMAHGPALLIVIIKENW